MTPLISVCSAFRFLFVIGTHAFEGLYRLTRLWIGESIALHEGVHSFRRFHGLRSVSQKHRLAKQMTEFSCMNDGGWLDLERFRNDFSSDDFQPKLIIVKRIN